MIRRLLARLVSAEVRRLEAELRDARAETALVKRELADSRAHHCADVVALALGEVARLGAAHGCWPGREMRDA